MSLKTPNQTKRRMPTEIAIRKHWAPLLFALKDFDSESEFIEEAVCFACGFDGSLERAHIISRSDGGDDGVENLHMLCSTCHKDSEFVSGATYFEWLRQRTIADRVLSAAARRGFNLHTLMMGGASGGKS